MLMFPDTVLETTTVTPTSYSGQKIPVKGCLHAEILHNGTEVPAVFFIVPNEFILGIDLVQGFDLHIEGSKLKFLCKDTKVLEDTQLSTNQLSCVQGFVHKIKRRANAKPIQQKLRCLPLVILEDVTKELLKLASDGIIERIDASE